MLLYHLPEHILIEIFRMLSIKEIIRMQSLCKYFNSLYRECPMLLFNSLRGLYKSPFFPANVRPTYLGVKRIFTRINNSKIMMLEMLAYYTNGGYIKNDPYDSMINVFSSNLFDSCYTSVTNKNILLKALFCGGKFNYSINRGKWEKQGLSDLKSNQSTEIELIELKKKLETVLLNTCKDIIITGFCIEKPSLMNKSSFRTCIIFSSLVESEDQDFIDYFKSVNDSTTATTIATSLGIESKRTEDDEYTLILFKEAKFSVHPLCWLQFHSRNIGTEVLHINLEHQYIGSYLYIMFIDGFEASSQSLDIGTFITKGKILVLYE